MSRAGVNTAWMQQYRYLYKKNKNCDPRQQLITDLCADIQHEQIMQSKIVVLGDFNEDMEDPDKNGIKRLIQECDLVQAFQEIKGRMSSTRGNNRSKDHVFVDYRTIHHIRLMGFVPDEVGFASDHICLHVDFSPSILDTKNTPIPPAPHWILKMHNMPKVLEYITGVKTRFEDHNVVQRV